MSSGFDGSEFPNGRSFADPSGLPAAWRANLFVTDGAVQKLWPGAAAARAGLRLVQPPERYSPPQLRRQPERVVSLFAERLAAGREIVAPQGNLSPAYRRAKRLLDLLLGLALLVLLSPVMIATCLVLLVTTRGKPIFCQTRLGYCGRPFRMYKFRTMYPDAERRQADVPNEQDGPVFKNRRDPRTTRIGRLLRVTSIDETPQLFNVLAGHMSLVGPRPPVVGEVAQYQPWQRRRLAVKPGLTCIWQVSGRSEIGFEDWVRMDLRYVRTQCLATDLKLLALTPWCVLNRRGAY
jgi:lipopolysaccharide/colanic/teichoic acid biosynthesis glycosyltransferase